MRIHPALPTACVALLSLALAACERALTDAPPAAAPQTLSVTPATGGSVRSTPSGIDCGSACTASFAPGTTVTLQALPAAGFRFDGWQGDCSGADCTLRMDAPRSASARFAALPLQRLTVTRSGDGAGRVVSTPAGIDCGESCAADFTEGSRVTLAAQPAPGFAFDGWSGDCSGTSACSLSLDAARTVDAAFRALPTPLLSVTPAGDGSGRIVSTPAGIDCPGSCSAAFAEGAAVTLAATATAGSRFDGWSGACGGSGACSLTMSQARAVGASFTALPPAPVGSWELGDLHVHDDHSSDGSGPRQASDQQLPGNVSISDQVLQGRLKGLTFMPLTDHRTYDQHYDPLWESDALLLIPGEEANGSPHSTVHGAVEWIVQGASRAGPGFDRLQTSIWDAQSQGAAWCIAHPDDGELNDDGTPNAQASAVGMHCVETWNRASGVEREIDYAEDRWNRGWRFGMAGGSDDHFRELWAVAGPGTPTTDVFAASASERGILQGLQRGRTRIALEPDGLAPSALLEADFQGDGVFEAMCGDEVIAPQGRAGTLRIRVANALGTTVHLYKSPGRSAGPLRSFTPGAPSAEYRVEVAVEDAPTWYRLELRGPGQPAGLDTNAVQDVDLATIAAQNSDPNALRAVCSPIFVSSAPVSPQAELPLPADIGTDDGATLALAVPAPFSAFPDLAASPGALHVVAEWHDAGATHLAYRRLVGASEATVLMRDSASMRFPRIAARGNDVWIAWQDERAGQVPRRPAIYLRHSADGGRSWGAEHKLREIDGRAERPALALLADGTPVVAWQEISAGNPFDVMLQVGLDAAPVNLSRAGKTIAAASPLDTRSSRYPASVWPSVAVGPDDRIAVAFHDNRDDPDPLWTGQTGVGETGDVDDWQLRVMTRAPGASEFGSAVTLGDDHADRHVALAFDREGVLVAAWDRVCRASSGCNVEVVGALSRDGGASWTAPEPIAPASEGMGQYPRLGVDPSGAVRAAWYDSRSADWRWRVMTATLDGLGHWRGATLIGAPGTNTWPATDGGHVAFASTRNAQRLQRDATQQVFVLDAPPP